MTLLRTLVASLVSASRSIAPDMVGERYDAPPGFGFLMVSGKYLTLNGKRLMLRNG